MSNEMDTPRAVPGQPEGVSPDGPGLGENPRRGEPPSAGVTDAVVLMAEPQNGYILFGDPHHRRDPAGGESQPDYLAAGEPDYAAAGGADYAAAGGADYAAAGEPDYLAAGGAEHAARAFEQPHPPRGAVESARQPRTAPVPIRYEHAAPALLDGGPLPVALEGLEIRRKSVPAKLGWRGIVNSLTNTNIAPGRDEVHELGLKERVQRLLRTTFTMAVVAVKGGVGKTVVTEALGSTFSAIRGDRVIAVDLDPDAGNLIARHGRETSLSISDLCADRSLTRYLDVRAHTSQDKATRLEVLTGPDYAHTLMPLSREEVDTILPILREHYSLVLMDTGCGLKTNLMTSILANSQALVLVSSASIDSLEETLVILEWLRCNGYRHLLDSAVLLINHTQRGRSKVNVDKAVEQFSHQIRRERIFVLPFDDHVAEGREITLELMSGTSRRRYLEVAAAISDLYPPITGN